MSETTNGLAESTGVTHPLVLVQSMIERGADPDALKKMMDLAERFQANQALRAFNVAMNKTQARMPMVLKTKKGQTAKYAPLENIHIDLKPIYVEEGFSISYGTEEPKLENHIRVVADVMHRDGHERRYFVDMPLDGTGPKGGALQMNAPQATGSTYSYARRYLLCLIFNITLANEDNDAEAMQVRIGPEEIRTINDSLNDCREAGIAVDFAKFLKWLTPRGQEEPLESLEFVRLCDFAKAMAFLTKRLRDAKKEASKL